jgi:ankyrin repeat protein
MAGKRVLTLTLALAAMFAGGRAATPWLNRVTVLNPQLAGAIRASDLPRAERLVAAGADVNLRNVPSESGWDYNVPKTLLGLAARQSDASAIRRLIRRGADVNLRESTGGVTPLMLASAAGAAEAVSVLLKAGAEVNARNSGDETALMYAATQGGRTEIMGVPVVHPDATTRLLLAAGADPSLKDYNGKTALVQAEEAGERNVIAALRKVGAPGLREEYAGQPEPGLFYAVRTNDMRAVKRLIRGGSRVAVQDRRGMTPLMYAAEQHDGRTIHYLLRHAPDVKAALELKDGEGATALVHACDWEYSFAELLQAGADPNVTWNGGSLFNMTLSQQHKLLLKAGAKPPHW